MRKKKEKKNTKQKARKREKPESCAVFYFVSLSTNSVQKKNQQYQNKRAKNVENSNQNRRGTTGRNFS